MSSYQGLSSSNKFVAHTKSDTELIKYNGVVTSSKRIYVGNTGTVTVVNSLGDFVTYPAVPAGTYLHVVTTQIRATDTAASGFVVEF